MGTLGANFVIEILISPALHIQDLNLSNQKAQEIYSARASALTQINHTIKEGHIDLKELAQSTLLGESYVGARPSDCLHCSDPEELVPGREAKYYETHINKCLWRPDRINSFKDSQIALIKKIIATLMITRTK